MMDSDSENTLDQISQRYDGISNLSKRYIKKCIISFICKILTNLSNFIYKIRIELDFLYNNNYIYINITINKSSEYIQNFINNIFIYSLPSYKFYCLI